MGSPIDKDSEIRRRNASGRNGDDVLFVASQPSASVSRGELNSRRFLHHRIVSFGAQELDY